MERKLVMIIVLTLSVVMACVLVSAALDYAATVIAPLSAALNVN